MGHAKYMLDIHVFIADCVCEAKAIHTFNLLLDEQLLSDKRQDQG